MDNKGRVASNISRRSVLRTTGIGLALGTGSTLASGATEVGEKKWKFSTGGPVQTSPTIVEETVYIGSDDKNLYALDASSGKQSWKFETGAQLYSSAVVVDGTVYTASEDRRIYALNAADGTQQWSFETGGDVNSSPTVSDGLIYIGSNDQHVYALDTENGDKQWEFEAGGNVASSPTIVDGTVYIGSNDNTVYALNGATGSEKWGFATNGAVVSSPTVADGTVYVGSYDGNIYALDAATGEQKWQTSLDSAVYTSPTVANGFVYAADYWSGTLYEVDPSSGDRTPIAASETADPMMSSPTVADGIIYIGDGEGTFYAFDPNAKTIDQIKQWDFDTGSRIESSPTAVDGTVYVGSNNGSVYALNMGTSESSTGTRVQLGTLGHHFAAAGSDDSLDHLQSWKDAHLTTAQRVDDISVSDLNVVGLAEGVNQEYTGAVKDGKITEKTAAAAVERLQYGLSLTERALEYIGPADELKGDGYTNREDLTQKMAKPVLTTALELGVAAAGAAARLAKGVGAGAKSVLSQVKEQAWGAVKSLMTGLLGKGLDSVSKAKVETESKSVVDDLQRGAIETVAELDSRIESIASKINAQVSEELQRYSEVDMLASLSSPVLIGESIISTTASLNAGILLFYSQLSPSRIQKNGLYGKQSQAIEATINARGSVKSQVEDTQGLIQDAKEFSEQLGLTEAVIDLFNSPDLWDAARTLVSAVLTVVGSLPSAFATGMGLGSLIKINTLHHYGLFRNIRGKTV